MHRYCAGVSTTHYELLSNSPSPFNCSLCAQHKQAATIGELHATIATLSAEVAALRAALQAAKSVPQQSAPATKSPSSYAEVVRSKNIRHNRTNSRKNADASSSNVKVARPNLNSEKVMVSGARRVWGTMKETTTAAVKNTIRRLSGCEMELKVRRKTKELSNNRYLWWFVLHDDEERLQMLETAWGKVLMHTNWKLEPCLMTDSKVRPNSPPAVNESSDTAATISTQTTVPTTDAESRPSNENTTHTIGEPSSISPPADINSSPHSHSSHSHTFLETSSIVSPPLQSPQ